MLVLFIQNSLLIYWYILKIIKYILVLTLNLKVCINTLYIVKSTYELDLTLGYYGVVLCQRALFLEKLLRIIFF
ncbi:MAG: hypothetical protein DGJ47_001015 [Rickettsiaceae bacterium]